MNKRLIVFSCIFVLACVILTNSLINFLMAHDARLMAERSEKIKPSVQGEDNTIQGETIIKPKRKLTAEDPAKYGIIVTPENELPRTSAQWDQYVKKVIVKPGVLDKKSAEKALEYVRMTPDAYEKRASEIENKIKEFEQTINNNPSDEETERRLQTYYLLKALLSSMKEKIISFP
ncbi:MAG: hypothetical protein ABIJ41_07255 [Candidatus Omnitrophota bacterium]